MFDHYTRQDGEERIGAMRMFMIAAVALLFGLTRLAQQVHTVADVTVGAAVGVAGTIAMRKLAGQRPRRVASPLLPAIVLAMMLLFHGDRLEAESHIRWLALDIWPLTLCR